MMVGGGMGGARLAAPSTFVPLAMAVDVDEDDRILPEWHDIVKESGMTPVTMGTLKKSFGAPREQWRQALQNELEAGLLREHALLREAVQARG